MAVPAGGIPEANKKSGTTIVKSAPPKETARITVKPSLPTPSVKPAIAAVAAKPTAPAAATTPVNVPGAAPKPGAPGKTAVVTGVPVAAKPAAAGVVKPITATNIVIPEEGGESTTLTTALAGALALFSWITFGGFDG